LVLPNFVKYLKTYTPPGPNPQVKNKIPNFVRFSEFQISPGGGQPPPLAAERFLTCCKENNHPLIRREMEFLSLRPLSLALEAGVDEHNTHLTSKKSSSCVC
jgi:hypothetical protein